MDDILKTILLRHTTAVLAFNKLLVDTPSSLLSSPGEPFRVSVSRVLAGRKNLSVRIQSRELHVRARVTSESSSSQTRQYSLVRTSSGTDRQSVRCHVPTVCWQA